MAKDMPFHALARYAASAYTIWYVVGGLGAFSEPGTRAHGVQDGGVESNQVIIRRVGVWQALFVVFKVKK